MLANLVAACQKRGTVAQNSLRNKLQGSEETNNEYASASLEPVLLRIFACCAAKISS